MQYILIASLVVLILMKNFTLCEEHELCTSALENLLASLVKVAFIVSPQGG